MQTIPIPKFNKLGFGGSYMKVIDTIALILVIIGCVNWGLYGLFSFDLVAWLFGELSIISRIVYVIIGVCGLYLLSFFGRVRSDLEH